MFAPVTVSTVFVAVTRTEGSSEPSITVHYTLDGAQDDVDEATREHAAEVAWDAKMAARGWKGPFAAPTTFEVVTVTGAKAAELHRICDDIDFNSQDEAQSDTRNDLYGLLLTTFLAA